MSLNDYIKENREESDRPCKRKTGLKSTTSKTVWQAKEEVTASSRKKA